MSDPTTPHLYLEFLGNITNVIGRVLESALYQAQLTESNAELRRIRDELETRVAERTGNSPSETTRCSRKSGNAPGWRWPWSRRNGGYMISPITIN